MMINNILFLCCIVLAIYSTVINIDTRVELNEIKEARISNQIIYTNDRLPSINYLV